MCGGRLFVEHAQAIYYMIWMSLYISFIPNKWVCGGPLNVQDMENEFGSVSRSVCVCVFAMTNYSISLYLTTFEPKSINIHLNASTTSAEWMLTSEYYIIVQHRKTHLYSICHLVHVDDCWKFTTWLLVSPSQFAS